MTKKISPLLVAAFLTATFSTSSLALHDMTWLYERPAMVTLHPDHSIHINMEEMERRLELERFAEERDVDQGVEDSMGK